MMRFEYPGVTRDQAMRWRLKRIFKTDDEIDEDLGGEIDNAPARSTRDHHVSRLADLLCEASDGEVDRAQALNWLLHHRDGRALVAQLHKREMKGVPPMNRADQLEGLVRKCGSFVGLCKSVAAGRHRDITERELSLLAKGYAMNRFPELTGDAAFAKAYGDARSSGEARAFWDACETLKQAGFMPTRLDDEDEEDDDEGERRGDRRALDEIAEKAAALRKRDPSLTSAQAFTKAYEQNPELAKRERKRHGFGF
jgi:hypothetical protein